MRTALLLLCALCAVLGSALAAKSVMPWMGLERTGESIAADLQQLTSNADIFQHVSFECYNLGADSTLVKNNLTQVNDALRAAGIKTFPMVSTYNDTCHHECPDTILHIRQLLNAPQKFVASAIAEAEVHGYSGFNIDLEPTGSVDADGLLYPTFVAYCADEFAKHGLTLTIDIASWGALWNFTALSAVAKTRANLIIYDMDGYAGADDTWQRLFNKAVAAFGPAPLGMGLITTNPNTGAPFTLADMQMRMDAIQQSGIQSIGIWDAPVPADWLPLLKEWLAAK
jgi:hypothetical protein